MALALDRIDTNNSGQIEYKEFEAWFCTQEEKHKEILAEKAAGSPKPMSSLRKVWEMVDVDQSEFLDVKELGQLLTAIGQTDIVADPGKLQKVFASCVGNGTFFTAYLRG
eukprot:SAG11_NODE_19130_length_473_cov_1.858289_1_plen_109_part_01